MAAREGWEIIGEFTDEAYSAWKGNRGPGLHAAQQQAEQLAAQRGGCVLVAQHSDRFARGDGRSAQHLGELLFWALKRDVHLRSVQDDSTFTNPLLAFAMGERNAEDSRRKAAAVSAGMRRRADRGLHHGGPRKFGYRHVRDSHGRTVPDEPLLLEPDEAATVRRIFESYGAGKSQQQIQRELNADGIVTALGRRWHQGTLGKILADPFYKGYVIRDGQLIRGLHEPIVSEELWEKAAQLRAAGQKSRGGRRGRRPKARHLFTHGHLRCGRCGGPMIPRTSVRTINGKAYPYSVYRCLRRVQDKTACEQTPVARELVDEAVLSYFQQVGLSLEETQRQIAEAISREVAEARVRRKRGEHDEQAAVERLERVRGDYVAGKLPVEDWNEFRPELTSQLEAARAKLALLRAREQEIAARATNPDVEQAVLRQLSAIREAITGTVRDAETIEAVRAALTRLFDAFTLYEIGATAAPNRIYADLAVQGGYVLEPTVREEVIEGFMEHGTPILQRESLATTGQNKYANGLTT